MIDTLLQVTNLDGDTIYLDLYDDVSVNLNLSFAEIQDVTSRNSGYSQTFKVPGTPKNNEFFNYMFNVNQEGLSFNVQKSVVCSINYKGNTVLDGILRLLKVVVNNNYVDYEVNIQDEVGVFINKISNKLLIDLDYSDLNHTYNATNVQDSWDAVYTGTTTSGGLLNGAILYPFAHIGYIYDVNSEVIKTGNNSSPLLELNGAVGSITNITTPMKTTGFKPAIQIKQVIERIFQQNGYDVESSFFDEEYFQRLYLPLLFNSDNYYIVAPGGTDGTSQVTTISDTPPDGFSFTGGTYFTIQGVVAWDEYVYNNGPEFSTGYGWTYNERFIPWVGGNYTFDWSLKLAIPSNYNPSTTQIAGSVYLYKNRTIKYGEVSFVTYPPDNSTMVYNTNQVIPLLPGDYVELVVQFIVAYPNTYSSYEVVNPIIVSRVSTATVTDAPNLVIGSTVIVKDQFTDEYKQLDFLKGLITQFNLVFVKHPYKTDTYIMEPYSDYVAKGDVLDWTDKLDKSKSIEISPITNMIGKAMDFKYQEDADSINSFTKSLNNNRNFGTYNFIPSGVTINDKPIEFTSFFSPSPCDILTYGGTPNPFIVPQFYGAKDVTISGVTITQLLPMKLKPRILHYGGLISANPEWYFKDEVTNTTITYNTYPLLNHQNFIPSAPTDQALDLNFGNSTSPQDIWAPTQTEFTAYNLYYRDYIEGLLSENARMVSANFYLTILDVTNLKYSDLIFVKDAFYRINKISNFNLINDTSTRVELVKLLEVDFEEVIPPVPVVSLTPTQTPTVTLTSTPTRTPGLSPSATPTITPTSTVTPTRTPTICKLWQVQNEDENSQYVYWTDCTTLQIANQLLTSLEILEVCSVTEPGGVSITVIDLGSCPVPTPSPTATQTGTPTVTPTQTQTRTPGLSPSPTTTPTSTQLLGVGFGIYTGATYLTATAACNAGTYPSITIYLYNDSIPSVGDYFFNTQACIPGDTFVGNGNYYRVMKGSDIWAIQIGVTGQILAITNCLVPTSTPTSTVTQTPTQTPTQTGIITSPTPTATITVTPTTPISTFTVYLSETSAEVACNGGDTLYGVYHLFHITGNTNNLCTSTSFTINELPSLDFGTFWLSDGVNNREVQRTGGPSSKNAIPLTSCATCPLPTTTPTVTPTQTGTPAVTPSQTGTPAVTPTQTPTNTVTPTITATPTVTPSYPCMDIGTGFSWNTINNNPAVIREIKVQNDNTFYVGGAFTSFNGTNVTGMTYLNYDGSINTGFTNYGIVPNNVNSSLDYVNTIEKQTDGKLLVGGGFTSYSGNSRNRIMRLNSNGTLDTSFVIGTGFNASRVWDIEFQPLSPIEYEKIIVAGSFTSYSGVSKNQIIRLDIDGSVDNTFTYTSPSGVTTTNIYDVELIGNGKMYIAGDMGNLSTSNYKIYRLNSDGTIDNTFTSPTFDTNTLRIVKQSDGKIFVGGPFTSVNSVTTYGLVRLNTDGSVDNTFTASSSIGGITDIIILSDGKFLVSGFAFPKINVWKLNSDGSLDTSFTSPTGNTQNFATQEVLSLINTNEILYGGGFSSVNGYEINSLVKLKPDGTVNNCNLIPISPTPTPTITRTSTPTPTVTKTLTPTPTIPISTFNLYVSETSSNVACAGGDTPAGSYHQFVVTGNTNNMCTSTSFTCDFITLYDLYQFWVSDGTNSRSLTRSGGLGSEIATPDGACSVCVTPTSTPTGTIAVTPTPTVTSTVTPTQTPTTTEPCYGYNLTPVYDTTCDASGDAITAYKNTGGAILVNDVLRNSCGGTTLATGQYTDGTYRYTVSVGTVTNKDLCPTPEPSPTSTPTVTPTSSLPLLVANGTYTCSTGTGCDGEFAISSVSGGSGAPYETSYVVNGNPASFNSYPSTNLYTGLCGGTSYVLSLKDSAGNIRTSAPNVQCQVSPTPTPTVTQTPTPTPEACYGYNLTPVYDTTCDASGDAITAYKNTGGSIIVNDVLRNSCGGSTLATGFYSDGTYRYVVNVGEVTDKIVCPTPEPSPTSTPTPTVTRTPTPTLPSSATLSWSYSETGGAVGEMRIYVNSSVVETRTNTSSGTYTIYQGDTIYVEIELLSACSGGDNKGNVYSQSNRGTLVDADCFISSTGTYTSPTYTVVSGDLGTTITLDTYASCLSICL